MHALPRWIFLGAGAAAGRSGAVVHVLRTQQPPCSMLAEALEAHSSPRSTHAQPSGTTVGGRLPSGRVIWYMSRALSVKHCLETAVLHAQALSERGMVYNYFNGKN